ncbi:MAG: ribonuclease Y [Acidobacteriota bacterium]|jgi:ribonuclease Y
MDSITLLAVSGIAGGLVGATVAFFLVRHASRETLDRARKESAGLLRQARREAEEQHRTMLLAAREQVDRRRGELEEGAARRLAELEERERLLDAREDRVRDQETGQRKVQARLDSREAAVRKEHEQVASLREELERSRDEYVTRLERVAGLGRDEAKKLLLNKLRSEARYEAARIAKEIRDEAREVADREATRIISLAIERSASEITGFRTVSTVKLPTEKIKGRLIGHEGKNIRAFEKATGMQLIVDESPDSVVLSGFNPIKREIARLGLEKLIKEGNINPRRIDEVIDEQKRWMIKHIQKVGEQTLRELGIREVHTEICRLLGRLKYRTSYGQNVLEHSIEVAHLTAMMAAELGLDEKIALRAGLLHDIGKAIDYEREGTHPEIGMEIAKKYHEPEIVVNAIASHHEDVEVISPISVLVSAADAISGSRPGARRRTVTDFAQRIEKLEGLANSMEGVEHSYAIQAGREIRVIAQHAEVDDARASMLAAEIAQQIQSQMEYPGKIKVTVIREMRAVDYAR